MKTTTLMPTTQQPWTSPALVPACAPASALVLEAGPVRVPGTRVSFAPASVVTPGHVGRDGKRFDVTGFRAAGAETTHIWGTPAWRPPTS